MSQKPDFDSRKDAVEKLAARHRDHNERKGVKVTERESRAYAEKIAANADRSWEKN